MIKINSNEVDFIENENLYELLKRNDFNPEFVAVEVFSFVGGG